MQTFVRTNAPRCISFTTLKRTTNKEFEEFYEKLWKRSLQEAAVYKSFSVSRSKFINTPFNKELLVKRLPPRRRPGNTNTFGISLRSLL